MTHKSFTLANTMGEIELVVCVHEAHPIIAPPITKCWMVVVPKDFVMRPVHLFASMHHSISIKITLITNKMDTYNRALLKEHQLACI